MKVKLTHDTDTDIRTVSVNGVPIEISANQWSEISMGPEASTVDLLSIDGYEYRIIYYISGGRPRTRYVSLEREGNVALRKSLRGKGKVVGNFSERKLTFDFGAGNIQFEFLGKSVSGWLAPAVESCVHSALRGQRI